MWPLRMCVALLQFRYALMLHMYILTPTLRLAHTDRHYLTPGMLELRPPPERESELQLHAEMSKVSASEDFFSDLQSLMFSLFHLVQPPNSNSNPNPNTSRLAHTTNKKPKKPKFPVYQKLGFGNFSFNLGFALNFELDNNFGFNHRLH